jgi:membrane peptidoglycan carboxypeptidase
MLTPERSFSRKFKELILAFWAERMFTKDQILEMYFNQVPYGGTAWGAEAASETYFNKSVKKLTLAESAFLAGLTSAPTAYSPYGANQTAWKKRQKEVLQRMTSLHYISQKQATDALEEKLYFRKQQTAIHAPHFVDYINNLLIKNYGLAAVEKGGLQVYTTLDLKTQEMAEKIVKEEVANASSLNLSNGATVITNPQNGDILAMIGSHDFDDPSGGNVNIATSLRQPGSSIKVVTYSAALSHGFTSASMLDDNPATFSGPGGEAYIPVNYDGKFHGRVSLRTALANSLNIPAVNLINQVGVSTMVNLAKSMGIENWGDPNSYGLPITLGSAEVTMLDMARVNGVLSNKGKLVDLNPILKITTVKGETFEEKKVVQSRKVLDEGVTYILSNILADNQARSMEFGSNSPLLIPGHTVSVKTGTSDNKRDNWTNGYTNNYVVVVWVGNNDNTPMSQTLASGITGAAPIWHRIMTNLLRKTPETKPTLPTDVVQKICFGKTEYFIKGTENNTTCDVHQTPSPAYSKENRYDTL